MKVALLSGAYKNSGDFLIERRTRELICNIAPHCEINIYLRNQIADKISEINQNDKAVFCGGPLYKQDLEGYLPLDVCINELKIPSAIIGGGWYGAGDGNNQVVKYRFAPKTKQFFESVKSKGGLLSARDILSYEVLKENGFDDVIMSGCPAWYDLENIEVKTLKSHAPVKKIVFSDPASRPNIPMSIKVMEFIMSRYPDAEYHYAFHRGISDGAKEIQDFLKSRSIDTVDLSGDSSGFAVYDDCDLHVGYRVHAHIYCLSKRVKTVLIEEDGRGAGVNRTLGLPGIKAYGDFMHGNFSFGRKLYRHTSSYTNKNLINQIGAFLEVTAACGDQYYTNAFAMQRSCFEVMRKTIETFLSES